MAPYGDAAVGIGLGDPADDIGPEQVVEKHSLVHCFLRRRRAAATCDEIRQEAGRVPQRDGEFDVVRGQAVAQPGRFHRLGVETVATKRDLGAAEEILVREDHALGIGRGCDHLEDQGFGLGRRWVTAQIGRGLAQKLAVTERTGHRDAVFGKRRAVLEQGADQQAAVGAVHSEVEDDVHGPASVLACSCAERIAGVTGQGNPFRSRGAGR